jgi:cell wall-associated NlpC family hydrolase
MNPVQAALTAIRYRKPLMVVFAVVVVVALIAGAGVAALFLTVVGAPSGADICATSEAAMAPASAQAPLGEWSAEQMTNAATIVEVGEADQVPEYGWVIAVATAIQESDLINVDYGTSDSLGLFQQQPDEGWGTPAQVMDPVYAANKFYQALLQVPGWQQLPLTVAAQDVQRSAYPDAYAQWQDAATAIVDDLTGGTDTVSAAWQSTGCTGANGEPVVSSQQLQAVLDYAYAALGTMYQYGGSCTDPQSTNMALHCDCSSLVQQSFAQAGLQLPRTAEAQWEWGLDGNAQVIPYGQEQIGDVVYFPSYLGPDIIGHTGIVVDPAAHLMLDAPETGEPVGFSSYAPQNLPYGTHLFTILRFLSVTGSST